MKYISQPPLLLDVHIHKPLLPARTWMDSLLAFFPGLQVRLDHVNSNVLLVVKHFRNTTNISYVPGAEGRYPPCHRDSWDVVPSYQKTQLPARGSLSAQWNLTIRSDNLIWLVLPTKTVWNAQACTYYYTAAFSLHLSVLFMLLSTSALTPLSFSGCPQAFTTDFRVHWAQHPLRPEFAESTYFLYKVIYQVVWHNAGILISQCGFNNMQ